MCRNVISVRIYVKINKATPLSKSYTIISSIINIFIYTCILQSEKYAIIYYHPHVN